MRWATSSILLLGFGWQVAFGCGSDQVDNDSYAAGDSALPNLMNSGGVENSGQYTANSGQYTANNGQYTANSGQYTANSGQAAPTPTADQNVPEQVSQDAGASAGPTSLVLPIERQGRYVLEFENLSFECNEAYGGRITAFEMEGKNVLAGTQVKIP